MRLTKKRNGKNVIPLLNAVCGIDMPYWKIDRADALHSYLSGDAADKLAAYEDAEEQGRLVEVVRCQECEFWERNRISCEGVARCKTGESGVRFRGKHDYCSRGMLPCKVGDTVYRICPKCNTFHDGSCANCAWQGIGGIGGCMVFGLWGDGSYPADKCTIVPWQATWNNMETIIHYLNKRIFLTREEAEAALKGEQEDV